MRNPSRTSATAAALMIGVSLVTFVAVFGAGIKSAAKGEMADKIQARYVVAPDGWANVSAGSLEAASQKLGVALALKPLVDADLKSGRLCAPFDLEWKPRSSYYLVCPEVIAERPAVAAFRAWLLSQV